MKAKKIHVDNNTKFRYHFFNLNSAGNRSNKQFKQYFIFEEIALERMKLLNRPSSYQGDVSNNYTPYRPATPDVIRDDGSSDTSFSMNNGTSK